MRAQLADLAERLGEGDATTEIRESAEALEEAMGAVEKALYQTQNQSRQDPLNFPIRLNDKLGGVASLASIGDAAPTSQAYAVRDELLAAIDAQLAKLNVLWNEDLPALNESVRAAAVPALSVEGD